MFKGHVHTKKNLKHLMTGSIGRLIIYNILGVLLVLVKGKSNILVIFLSTFFNNYCSKTRNNLPNNNLERSC